MDQEWERHPRILRPAPAMLLSVPFPLLHLLHHPLPPHLQRAAVDWDTMEMCPIVQSHPHAVIITMTITSQKVLMLLTI